MENGEFEIFINELLKWNRVHKLTNYKTKEEISEQIVDSLYPLKNNLIDFNIKTAIDIGTGAGFPGLILAIAMKDTKWYLVEPLKKRVSFLNYIKSLLNLKNVEVVPNRLEHSNLDKVDLITSRAVMDTKSLLKIALPFAKDKILLYKGSNVENELVNCKYKSTILNKKNRNFVLLRVENG